MASEWVDIALHEACERVYSGGTPRSTVREYFDGGTIPWLKTKEVKYRKIYSTESKITDAGLANSSAKFVPINAVIVAMYGDGDTAGRVAINKIPLTTNQACCNLLIDPNVADYRFIYYLLRAKYDDLVDLKNGGGQQNLNAQLIKSLKISLPAIDVQASISDLLEALDDKTEELSTQNETLEAIARAIFKSWFVDFDPVRAKAEGRETEGMDASTADLFPASLMNSELGEIPQGWAATYIGECAEIVGGSTPSTANAVYWNGGQHCWATPKDLSNNKSPVLLSTERRVTDEGRDDISSGLLPVDTVLLSSRAPIGYLAIAKVPTAINQGFIALKPLGKVSSEFLILWAAQAMETIKSLANGSTFQEISKRNFRTIQLARPSGEVLDAFNAIVKPLYDRITTNAEQVETLSQLRDTLLPRLISGKLRLPEAEKLVEAVL